MPASLCGIVNNQRPDTPTVRLPRCQGGSLAIEGLRVVEADGATAGRWSVLSGVWAEGARLITNTEVREALSGVSVSVGPLGRKSSPRTSKFSRGFRHPAQGSSSVGLAISAMSRPRVEYFSSMSSAYWGSGRGTVEIRMELSLPNIAHA